MKVRVRTLTLEFLPPRLLEASFLVDCPVGQVFYERIQVMNNAALAYCLRDFS